MKVYLNHINIKCCIASAVATAHVVVFIRAWVARAPYNNTHNYYWLNVNISSANETVSPLKYL